MRRSTGFASPPQRTAIVALVSAMLVGLHTVHAAEDKPVTTTGAPSSTATVATIAGMVTVAESTSVNVAEASEESPTERADGRSYWRRPYVAIGAGVTRLEPESPSPALTVEENMSFGLELGLGYDITRWLSAELYVADLGQAEIDFLGTDSGDVAYLVYGATAVFYLFGTRDGIIPFTRGRDGAFRREGLSLFTRFGIGGMSNNSRLAYERDHTAHAVFGVGLEYGFRNGVALRGEVQGFDTDARYAGVSVLKRFGRSTPPESTKVARRAPAAAAPAAPSAALPLPEASASDQAMGVGLPSAIYFAFDRSNLTTRSRGELDRFADAIRGNDYEILVGGHTDWIGTERYNVGLSDRRAQVVADYLISRGIEAERLDVRGYGESRPATPDTSDEGRALNRRSELRLR